MTMPSTSSFIRLAAAALALCAAITSVAAQDRQVPPSPDALQYS
jgi:hypothetical protein